MELSPANLATWNRSQMQLDLPRGESGQQLEAAAREFESLFVKQMLDTMRDTLNTENDIFNGGMAQDVFEDMLYEEYARSIAQSGTLGIADMLVEQYQGTTSRETAARMYDSLQS